MSQTHDNQKESPVTILGQIDTFRFVAGIAFVASIILVIFSVYLWVQLHNTVDRLDAVVQARVAEQHASNDAAVERCYASATQGPALNHALNDLQREVSPDTAAALQNLRRVLVANTTTIRECRQLAEKLGVQTPKGARQ